MDIEELVGFLRGKLESGSKIAFIGGDKGKDLEIETQQELRQEVLVGLIREFCQKDYRVIDTPVGLIVNHVSIAITASDIFPQSKPPPFHSFVTVN